MLPIAAPAIAAPAVAPASVVLAEALPGSTPAGAPVPAAAAQSGVDASVFALLLAPSPVVEIPAVLAPTPDEAAVGTDTGLAQLLSAFLGDTAAEPAKDAAKDGELLALLASFAAAAVPARQVPDAAGSHIDDILGEPLPASPAGPVVAATVEAQTPAMPTVSPPLPMLADEAANDVAAPVVSMKLPPAPLAEAVAILPASDQRVAPAAEPPAANPLLPVAMPVTVAADVAIGSAQTAAVPPAAPVLATAGAVADAGRKASALPDSRAQLQPQTAIATPATDADPAPAVEALQVLEPAMQVAATATAERPKPKAVQAVADAVPATTPAPETPVMAMPTAAPTVSSAAPAAAPLPTPVLAPGASAQVVESEAEAIPAVPHAPPAATTIATDASGQAIAAAPRAEPFSAVLRSEAAQPATGRSEPNPLERAVAHQVSRAIVQHLPDGGARMVMRLTPPELGTVRIEFISRDGMVTARLMAEDEGVRQALDRALPHIRAEVRSDHPTVDISVDRSDQRQAWGEGHARQERRDEPRTGQGRRRRDDEPLFTIDGVEPAVGATPVRAAQQLGGRVGPTLVDALA